VKNGNLYQLKNKDDAEALTSDYLTHRRMGHSSSHPAENCEVCHSAKQSRKCFSTKNLIEKDHSGLLCSDVMGPFEAPSNSGFKFIVTFILKKTSYTTVYPIRTKAQVKAKFEEFVKMISIKSDFVVRRLRSDNGGE
jgi:hypothetical protein